MFKNSLIYHFTLLVVLLPYFNGCDSPTDSKANSITSPSLVSPSDGATGVSLTPTFTWKGSADKLLIATNSNFDGALSYEVSGESYTLQSSLQRGTVYFWKVGITSGSMVFWSSPFFRFTTQE